MPEGRNRCRRSVPTWRTQCVESLQRKRRPRTIDKQVLNPVAVQIPYQLAGRQRRIGRSEGLRKGGAGDAVRDKCNRCATQRSAAVQKRDRAAGPGNGFPALGALFGWTVAPSATLEPTVMAVGLAVRKVVAPVCPVAVPVNAFSINSKAGKESSCRTDPHLHQPRWA